MTKTKTDELERERFEAWLRELPGFKSGDIQLTKDELYLFDETQWCWKAWQARAQLEKE